jgi:hypothetical protein
MTMTDEQALAVLDAFARCAQTQVCCGNTVGGGMDENGDGEPPSCCGYPFGDDDLQAARAHIAARLSEQGAGGGGVDYCQMDWSPLNQHTKRWTCRVCKKVKDANSADGHPLTWCAAPPAASAGVTSAAVAIADAFGWGWGELDAPTQADYVRAARAALSAARGE